MSPGYPFDMGGGNGVGGGSTCTDSQSSQIPNFHFGVGGFMTANFELLMLSPNLPKSQISIFGGGGDQLSTFDTESKSAQIPNFHFGGGGGCSQQPVSVLTSCEHLG